MNRYRALALGVLAALLLTGCRGQVDRPQVGGTDLVFVHDDLRNVGCWSWQYDRGSIFCMPDSLYKGDSQ